MAHFFKNIRETEVKVGGLVIVCLVILFFSYSWLNDWFVGNKYNKYQVLFESVSNLERGGSVFFRGMLVGKIDKLTITPEGVLVDVLVDNIVKIGNDAMFYIKDKDMMGTKSLEIMPSDSGDMGIATTNNIFRGNTLPGFSDLITNVNRLCLQVEWLINKIDGDDKLFDNIDKVLLTADESLNEMKRVMVNVNQSDLFAAFTEIKQVTQALNTLIVNNDEILSNTLIATTNTLIKVDSLITSAETMLTQLQPTDDSTVKKLLTDDELYQNIVNSVKELETIINDIKTNPKKYFKFSVF